MSGRRSNMRPSKYPLNYDEGTEDSGQRDTQKFIQGERQNDERLNQLHAKVSTLKNITIEIGNEVREQNKLLDGMGLEFDRAGTLLSQTMRQLTSLTQTEKGRSFLLYSAVFFVFIFVILFLRAMF